MSEVKIDDTATKSKIINICKGLGIIITALGLITPPIIIAWYTVSTHSKVEKVETIQDQNTTKLDQAKTASDNVKKTLEDKTIKDEKRLGSIEKGVTDTKALTALSQDTQFQSAILYFKRIIADETSTEEDIASAKKSLVKAEADYAKFKEKK